MYSCSRVLAGRPQHGAGDTEDRPLNTWCIIRLTKEKNLQLLNHLFYQQCAGYPEEDRNFQTN